MATAKTGKKKKASGGIYDVVGISALGGARLPAPEEVVGEAARGKASAMSGVIRARIDPVLKSNAEAILGSLGLNASDAIRLFYSQVALHRGLPFEVKIPNAATRKAMREADAGKGTAYASADEMFEKMGT